MIHSSKCLTPYLICQSSQGCVVLDDLVKQSHSLCRIRDPGSSTCEPGFEVIGPSREELVADMQGLAAVDTAKILLAGQHAPAFVSNIDENVVSA